MKKITLILTLLFNSLLFAQDFTVDGIEYTITSTADPYTVEVFDYTGTSTTVVIPTTVTYDGISFTVTTIGDYAFSSKDLVSVTIPNSITAIDEGAFYNNKLTNVTIPDSATVIGEGAFYNNKLTNVTIPDSVTAIDKGAFILNELTSVMIPDSVTSIGDHAFYGNNLTNVTSESLNPVTLISDVFDDRSGIKLSIPKHTEEAYETAGWTGFNEVLFFDTIFVVDDFRYTITSLTTVEVSKYTGIISTDTGARNNVTIPATVTHNNITYSVTTIGDYAFSRYYLTSVSIPDSVTAIGIAAFLDNNLTNVTIPDGVTTIGNAAFTNNNLLLVNIPESVTTIGVTAFAGNNLTRITIPNSVTTIGSHAFSDNKLTSVFIPESVTNISYGAFQNNELTSIFISNGVISIGHTVFNNNNLTTVTIPNSVTSIGDTAFSNNDLISISIPDSVTSIGDSAFSNNDLTSIIISNSVTSIGDTAFANNNLTTVTIPDSVTTIGDQAFSNNDLTGVISKSLNPADLLSNVFDDRSVIALNIPANTSQEYQTAGWTGFKMVSYETFTVNDIEYTITSLVNSYTVEVSNYIGTSTTVTIPDTVTYNGITFSVTTIGDYAFAENDVTHVTSESLNPGTLADTVFKDRSVIELSIPANTLQVYQTAGWTGFKEASQFDVTFSEDGIEYLVTSSNTVEAYNYTGASTTVIIPDTVAYNNATLSVTRIGNDAFAEKGLTSISIGTNVITIGEHAFAENDVTSLISKSLNPAILPNNAFDDSSRIDLTIHPFTTAIYQTAGWIGFKEVLPVLTFNLDGIVYNITALTDPYTVEVYDYTGTSTKVDIPSTVMYDSIIFSVTTIGEYAFSENSLINITIPNSVTTIGEYAFNGNSLINITIPNSVTTIGDYAFNGNSLINITIPNSVTTIGDYAFNRNRLISVTLGNSITTIGNYAFAINPLTSIAIPDSVITIGDYAFWENTSLSSVTIGNNVTYIGKEAFMLNDLTSVTIPDSVTSIGDSAFSNSKLTNVSIGNSLTTISAGAFIGNNLASITIPNSVTTIGIYAFFGNDLTSVISESLNPAILVDTVFDDRSAIDLSIPAGTTQAYVTAGWIGFKSITEVTTLSTTENTILKSLSFTSNANTIIITTTNEIRLERISLYNMSGQRILISKQTEVSINHLASGVYIAQLTTNLGTVAKKFAK